MRYFFRIIRHSRHPAAVICSISILLINLSPLPVSAAEAASDKWMAHTPDINSELSHGRVNAILYSSSGYIYLGTPAGLTRTDGAETETFNSRNTPGAEFTKVLSLYEDPGGRIWIGTGGAGVLILNNGRFEKFDRQDKLLSRNIRAITSDIHGNIWLGTDYRLYRVADSGIESYGLDQGLADNLITSVAADSSGNLWAGMMKGGLARIRNGQIRTYHSGDGLFCPKVLSLVCGEGGLVWIGTMDGLFVLDPERDRIDAEPVISPVTALDSFGDRIIAGTMTEGTVIIDNAPEGKRKYQYTADDHGIRSVVCLGDNVIWAGTEENGLVWITVPEAESLDIPEISIHPIIAEEQELWLGTGRRGLLRVSDGRMKRAAGESAGITAVRALFRDSLGRIWIGTRNNGLHIRDGDNIHRMTGLPSDNITSITGYAGRFWVGTGRGLVSIEDENILPVTALEGVNVHTLYPDPAGSLLAGTAEGLWKIDLPGVASRMETQETAPDILSVYRDREGKLWLGTNGSGLARFNESRLEVFSSSDGMPGNFIYSVTGTDDGYIWASCENGVFRISRDSLSAYAEGKTPVLTPYLFDSRDGMPSSRCSGYCSPCFAISPGGELLYPTTRGVAVIKPGPADNPPPHPVIRGLESSRGKSRRDGRISFPAGAEWVRIDFTAFHYPDPERITFLYRLEGHDREFIPVYPGRARTASYRSLPSGNYRFRVIAIGRGSNWSRDAAEIIFYLSSPFYLTGTFLVSAAALLLAAGVGLYAVFRIRKINRGKSKYHTTRIDGERREEVITGLESAMTREKVFLDPDLTLRKLAARLKIHSNYLSRIINEEAGVNFNEYINRYRIEEACRILRLPESESRNITDIMYQCGFYSKSTFNSAFKKLTGTTPSKYRRENS